MAAAQDHSLRVFISYAREDLKEVIEIVDFLHSQSIDIWFDQESLLPGQDREFEIERGIKNADAVIACLSRRVVSQEGSIQKELRLLFGKAAEKPEGAIFILPFKLDDCPLPSYLEKVQWLALSDQDWQRKIMRSLQSRADSLGIHLLSSGQRESSWSGGDSRRHPVQLETPAKPSDSIDPKELQLLSAESRHRVLEAAVEKETQVGKSTQLFIIVRRRKSKGLVSVIHSIDEDIILDKENIKSKDIQIEFPIKNNKYDCATLLIRLHAQEFEPQLQEKYISVPPQGDSEPCVFSIVPQQSGILSLTLELVKDQITLATRILRTNAFRSNLTNEKSYLIASMPIFVFVPISSEKPQKPIQPENISISIGGNVQGNLIIGNKNAVETTDSHHMQSIIQQRENIDTANDFLIQSAAINKFVDSIDTTEFSTPPVRRYWPTSPRPAAILVKHPNLPREILFNPFPFKKAEGDWTFLFHPKYGFFWNGHPLWRKLKSSYESTIIVSGEQGSGRTAFALALGKYLSDKSVLTIYADRPTDWKEVQRLFAKNFLDFLGANPFYLPINDRSRVNLLKQWINAYIPNNFIEARLSQAVRDLENADWIHDVSDQIARANYLVAAKKILDQFCKLDSGERQSYDPGQSFEVLSQCAAVLDFLRIRAVFDLGIDLNSADIANLKNLIHENQNRIEIIIFAPSNAAWVRQFGGSFVRETLSWKQGKINLLEQMVTHRWEIVSQSEPLKAIFSEKAFEHLIDISAANPSRFIALWTKVIDLKGESPKISIELINSAREELADE